ncbi:MAG: magnesium protoporphyrin IX methyltransferase [Pseudomonadota bacterium]
MSGARYERRRGEIATYFDRTAADAWARLTSDAPVSRIRQTVRAGRDSMRATLLNWLPQDLSGARLLDAGCGTGALAMEAAQRGAQVVAVDLSPTLVTLAQERLENEPAAQNITFMVGDMRHLELGHFDYGVAMDSLIHYQAEDMVNSLHQMSESVTRSIVFTFAPRTALLGAMHAVGGLFPRGNRAPSIEPIAQSDLWRRLDRGLDAWQRGRSQRVNSGFYISQACELVKS